MRRQSFPHCWRRSLISGIACYGQTRYSLRQYEIATMSECMIRSDKAARKISSTATKAILVALFIGGIVLAVKPSIKWIKGQLLQVEEAARQDSLKEQNRLGWCADVLESDSISESDYAYCEDFWKD